MAKPVFLLGYMGSGKTTVGKKLSKRLGYTFVDTDKIVSDLAGKSIREIFWQEGEDAFRQLEHSVLLSMKERENTVIATGGGMPCFFDNMALMKRVGITVYINMQVDSLIKRLHQAKIERPMLPNLPAEQLKVYIREHLEKRVPYYNEALIVVKGESLDLEGLVKAIREVRF